jgi:hypothetical protein
MNLLGYGIGLTAHLTPDYWLSLLYQQPKQAQRLIRFSNREAKKPKKLKPKEIGLASIRKESLEATNPKKN